jgi:L-aspartate oxidase
LRAIARSGEHGRVEVPVVEADVAVIGAGVAGLVAALDLLDARPDLKITILDKGSVGSAGSTPLAQGGMAAAVGPDDTPALHVEDTIRAGDGLCDRYAASVLATEAPDRIHDLVARGVVFDREADGALALSREAGQTVPRSVRSTDATGAEIFRALRAAATGRIERVQGIAWRLAHAQDGAAAGVWAVLDKVGSQPDGLALVHAGAVLLATGGCGGLYAATTNRDGATADGVALAAAAGAVLQDLEFVQFHPTGLRVSGGGFWRLLLTEALRGAGAVLVDADGRQFLCAVHPDAELAPRHVVTRAMLTQPGGVWLDCTALGADRLAEEFPTAVAGAQEHGFDLTSEPVPVEPCQHYMIGGVWTDLWGRTSVPGLYAAGEVACTGVHGASRMAGNSLAEACVFAHRVAEVLARDIAPRTAVPEPPPGLGDAPAPAGMRERIRTAMSAGAGPLRAPSSLARAAAELDACAEQLGPAPAPERESLELHHMVAAGRLIVRSARLRRESRGAHWREDTPERESAWERVHLRSV